MNNYWQIASGSYGRNFSKIFIESGIAFVGEQRYIDIIQTIKDGDRILLKEGKTIKAVGIAETRNGKVSGYGDLKFLNDIDGWSMPGYCFVKYSLPDSPINESALTRASITAIHKPEVIQIVDDLLLTLKPNLNCSQLPDATNDIKDMQIIEELIKFGLSSSRAKEVTDQIFKIRLLASYYYNNVKWNDVREHETRSFLVVPLLLALGWPEQNIKIEYPNPAGKINIAIFKKPYIDKSTSEADCAIIIETKGFDKGLDFAFQQAENYSRHLPNLEVVVLSNGYCYKIFKKHEQIWQLNSYINLLSPQNNYPIFPSIPGALNVFQNLLPK